MSRFVSWVKGFSYPKLIGTFALTVIALPVFGWFAFYFPIYPIFALLGREFPNLGPIATAAWAVWLALFVVTPAFGIALLVKLLAHEPPKA